MLATSNRINDLLNAVVQQLIPLYDEREARAITDTLFAQRFDVTRVKLALNPDLRLSESEIVQVHKDLIKLKAGMPLQYVTGVAHFAGLKLKVTPDVLIPRPETEELVQLAIRIFDHKNPNVVMDIGTGSGAIALALKKHWLQANVYATDISPKSILVAEENAKKHHLGVSFLNHDILSNTWPVNEKIDLIVSNPPYIPAGEYQSMHVNVKHFEPPGALFVDDADPLMFYNQLGKVGYKRLAKNGWLIVETHHRFGPTIAENFRCMVCFDKVGLHDDLHGKQRFVSARKADCEKNDNFYR